MKGGQSLSSSVLPAWVMTSPPPIQPNLPSPLSRQEAGLNLPARSPVSRGHWDESGHDRRPQSACS